MSSVRYISQMALAFACVLIAHDVLLAGDDKNFDECLAYARARVFSIRAGTTQGSAVLLKVETKETKTYGYFGTCYHVLYQSKGFDVYPSGGAGAPIANHEGASVLVQPSLDLV